MSDPYAAAIALIDAVHAEDPTQTTVDGKDVPAELQYAHQMTAYLARRAPNASDVLRVAVRAQHLKRWCIPRSSYPAGKPGYLRWRSSLARRQADLAAELCQQAGVPADDADRVAALVRKEGLKTATPADADADVQILEDVACLVFLDAQLDAFEAGVADDDKVVDILRKTWVKMSPAGRDMALAMELSARGKELVGKALAG